VTAQLACMVDDVAPGSALRVELEGKSGPVEVAVARDSDGTFHAIADVCSHGQVALSDGDVEDGTIECWLHGSTFDLRTGRPLALPATRPVPVYPLTVDGDRVLVDVDTTVNA
jgi:3-phenylpropionate/trans-cinnamate dioxygenase ferredoxin component